MLQYILIIGTFLTTCKSNEIVQISAMLEKVDFYKPVTNWSDNFDWQLLKSFAQKNRNVLLSPISLKITLALLYEGSSGSTEKEFQNVLQFPEKPLLREKYKNIINALQLSSANHEYLLNLGSRIFLDSHIIPQQKYRSKTLYDYHTDIEQTDFSNSLNASQSVNAWIDKLTNGKIPNLVTPDDVKNAVMLITNAVYFKGTWRHQFPKNQTRYGKFFISDDKMVTVPYMMTIDRFYYHESYDLDAKILRLPYKGKRYNMFIVLPNTKGGLDNLIKKISVSSLHRNLVYLEESLVEVNIPKFRFNYQAKFTEVLKEYGLHQMFQNTASFPGIARGNSSTVRRLVVSDILQKSGIELDEEGSVVYAATDITIGNKFGDADNVFNASHPFMFFIEEQTNGTILFVGKIENPLEIHSELPNRFGQNSVSSSVATSQSGTNFNNNPVNLQPISQETQSTIPTRFNYFDLELLQEFSEIQGNVFISPASIKTTLAMLLEGAGGLTAQEIANALRIDNMQDLTIRQVLSKLLYDLNDKSPNTHLESSNKIFVSNKLKVRPEYQNNIVNYFRSDVNSVDFSNPKMASALINLWVNNATHGAIKELVNENSIHAETNLILANALYFKGKWKQAFDIKHTKVKCFKTLTKNCINTPLMHIQDTFNYNYIDHIDSYAIELPYQDKYSMLILLPVNDNGIKILTKDIQHIRFAEIVNSLQPNELVLEIPKFQIEFSSEISKYLIPLKIREVFGPNSNLSGIAFTNDKLRADNIIHKTKIEVDEFGTVAAGASGVFIVPLMGTTAQTITADHPFLFFIYNQQTKNIIFEGILMEPQNQQIISPQSRNLQFVQRNLGYRNYQG